MLNNSNRKKKTEKGPTRKSHLKKLPNKNRVSSRRTLKRGGDLKDGQEKQCKQNLLSSKSVNYKENYGFFTSNKDGEEQRKKAYYDYIQDADAGDACLTLNKYDQNAMEYEITKLKSAQDYAKDAYDSASTSAKNTYNRASTSARNTYDRASTSAKNTYDRASQSKTYQTMKKGVSDLGKGAYKSAVGPATGVQLGYFFAGFPNDLELDPSMNLLGDSVKVKDNYGNYKDGNYIRPYSNLKDNLRLLSIVSKDNLLDVITQRDETKEEIYNARFDEIAKKTYSVSSGDTLSQANAYMYNGDRNANSTTYQMTPQNTKYRPRPEDDSREYHGALTKYRPLPPDDSQEYHDAQAAQADYP